MSLPIRVGIVDDHPGVRIGIRNLLARAKDIEVVGEGENGEDALYLIEQIKPDVLLLDVELPVLRGDIVMQHIREARLNVKVLAVSSYNEPIYVQGMLENGAAGYITKEEAPRLLVDAVRCIMNDQVKWISPFVAKKTLKVTLDDKNFSGVELDILRNIVLGKENKDIMQELKVEAIELKKSIEQLMEKFDVSSSAELRNAAECILSTTS